MTYVGCDFGCKHSQFLKNNKALSTRVRIFSKTENFSPYLKKKWKIRVLFCSYKLLRYFMIYCLYFPAIKQRIFSSFIVWKPRTVRDRPKWPPNPNFARTNSHLGRTLSGDRPLFWVLTLHQIFLNSEIFFACRRYLSLDRICPKFRRLYSSVKIIAVLGSTSRGLHRFP